MPLKAREMIDRAWVDVVNDIDNADFTVANVVYTAAFLQGAEKYHAAAVVLALAEKAYGAHPQLLAAKRNMGVHGE